MGEILSKKQERAAFPMGGEGLHDLDLRLVDINLGPLMVVVVRTRLRN
jgi:hypothetical protein